MRKVLIIENKPTRIEEHKEIVNEVKKIDNVEWAEDYGEYDKFKELNNIPDEFWNRFDLLMIHRSYAYDINKLVELQTAYDKKGKDIVFFSGGAPQWPEYRKSERTRKAFMFYNASRFYSEYLIEFLKKYVNGESIDLQYLNDGEKWKMSILLNSRRLIEQKGIERFFEDGKSRDMLNENFPVFNTLFELYECVEYNDVKGAVKLAKLLTNEINVDSLELFSQTNSYSPETRNGIVQPVLGIDEEYVDENKNDPITIIVPDAKNRVAELYKGKLDVLIEQNLLI